MDKFYSDFFKEMLKRNKWHLVEDVETKEFVVFNNAWKIVKEGEQADVVAFLYEQRDYLLLRENQRLKFFKPAWHFKPTRAKGWKIEYEAHPIKMGVPLGELLAECED